MRFCVVALLLFMTAFDNRAAESPARRTIPTSGSRTSTAPKSLEWARARNAESARSARDRKLRGD
jgi:hypothetical protein